MDGDTDSPSLLHSVLGLFARIRPQRSAKPASLGSRKREAWLRADAFLQRDDIGDADPESVTRTLRAFEHLVPDTSGREIDFVGSLDIQHTPVVRSVGLFTSCLLTSVRGAELPTTRTRVVSQASPHDRESESRSACRPRHCHPRG